MVNVTVVADGTVKAAVGMLVYIESVYLGPATSTGGAAAVAARMLHPRASIQYLRTSSDLVRSRDDQLAK